MVTKTNNLVALSLLAAVYLPAAQHIITPKEALGYEIGDDYQLANYSQMIAWWKKLATESDRMSLVDIGQTEEGRTQWMAVVTSAVNQKNLQHYKDISRRLALAENLTDDQAHALAREGKNVVWIDGGLHASEVLGMQQLMLNAYQMLTRNDPETLRILNDDIILFVPADPDGMELVSDWYMREPVPSKRRNTNTPRLWQKYIGHDDNRDFYMANMKESANLNRQLYLEWFPKITHNHHQKGPDGVILFAPPFRDPFNYNCDPLVIEELAMLGHAMHTRFIAENKPGSTMRSGAIYSTWYNGDLRNTAYFHNIVGLLTEMQGSPSPMNIPLFPDKQLPTGDLPLPVMPQVWHFRQSVEYSLTSDRAVLDMASKYREDFLYNCYRMGKNSIERGSRDNWTITPKRIEAMKALAAKAKPEGAPQVEDELANPNGTPIPSKFFAALRDPSQRDPRGYIIPVDQPDFPTATKFINALLKNGIAVHRATADFEVAGKKYGAGSWVVKCAQAFRPHVLDMFEPQDYPNDFPYPGGPPIAPYDISGYNLSYQMGIRYDRIMDGFDGPFEKVTGLQAPPLSKLLGVQNPAGYLISHEQNDAFIAINRLMKNGDEVYWMKEPVTLGGRRQPPGTIYVPARSGTRAILEKAAAQLGIAIEGVASRPVGEALKLRPIRIALWDVYGGSITSGWMRWIFEQFEFPFEVIYQPTLDQGNLVSRFDVLVLPEEAASVPGFQANGLRIGGGSGNQPAPETIPEEYRSHLGFFSVEKTVPQFKKFVESGGSIVMIGSSTSIAELLGAPIRNGLVEKDAAGRDHPLPREKLFIQGAVMRVSVDNSDPVAYGMDRHADVFFVNSPAFRLSPESVVRSAKPVAWFDSAAPLRSGWAWGQAHLDGLAAAAEMKVGQGQLFLFGIEPAFRGQSHGTYKLLFNSLYAGSAR